MSSRPACAGKWELFDSHEYGDHLKAAAICAECPMIRECRSQLAEAKILAYAGQPGPSGTWAGKLVGNLGRPDCDPKRLADSEARFDEDEARKAHAAFNRGDVSEWAVAGHRVYDRRRRRAAKAARRAA